MTAIRSISGMGRTHHHAQYGRSLHRWDRRSGHDGTSPDDQMPLTRGSRSARLRSAGYSPPLAVILTLDGPGLTVDEPLDVRPGRKYLKILREKGRHFLDRSVVDRVFRDNAEHPPLGRWLLGIASVAAEPFEILLKGPRSHRIPTSWRADWPRLSHSGRSSGWLHR